MNANDILKEGMSLDDKLAAIDAAIAKAKEAHEPKASFDKHQGTVDPADLTICDGCE
mgnify:CR=1 FL=1